jgi:tripartite-type tricarboxylate transporter receptor subunit TctC
MEVWMMKKMASLFRWVIVVMLSIGMSYSYVAAADYPTKPITFICPMAAGGEGDLHIRAFASSAEKILGQPVVVVNKTGAAGMIGLQACAGAVPDGYTLALSANVFLLPIEWEIANGRKPLITLDDFISVGAFGQGLFVIAVPFDSPWKTLADLIQAGKAKPGQYVFASGGINHPSHIAVEMMMKVAGVKFRHVPYTGGAPSVAAVVGKHADFGAMSFTAAYPLAQGNKVRLLAVTTPTRYKASPETPTFKEFGIDYEWLTLSVIWAPQKTPKPVLEKLEEVVKKVCEDKSFVKTLEKPGSDVIFKSSDEVNKFMKNEREKFTKLFQQLTEEEKSKK